MTGLSLQIGPGGPYGGRVSQLGGESEHGTSRAQIVRAARR
jgi:hypothetical protein